MTNNKIFYLAIYSRSDIQDDERYYPLSGALKIEGITKALRNAGYEIEIISMSPTHGKISVPAWHGEIQEGVFLTLFHSLGRKNIYTHFLDNILIRISFLLYVLKHIRSTDTVIVYHSLAYMKMVMFLKKIIRFRLVLELEEIYADVISGSFSRKNEIRLIHISDQYILPTKLIAEKMHLPCDNYVVIHGSYQYAVQKQIHYFSDQKIHIVYAGTLDPRKGCIEAMRAAEYLPNNYVIHILGSDINPLFNTTLKEITEKQEESHATVIYEGLLKGEIYNHFLQKCHLGLCTQDPHADFTDTSFPSKVLSYLSNGLRVLAIRIKALETSDLRDILYFYTENKPECIADAIIGIDFSKHYDSSSKLNQLFLESVHNLKNLIDSQPY